MLEFLNNMCVIIQRAYGIVGMNCLLCFVNEFMIDSLINQSGLNLFWQVCDSEVVLKKENLYTDAHHSTPESEWYIRYRMVIWTALYNNTARADYALTCIEGGKCIPRGDKSPTVRCSYMQCWNDDERKHTQLFFCILWV